MIRLAPIRGNASGGTFRLGDSILYLPLATTGLAALFAWQVFRRWRTRTASVHLAWYAAGFALYGAGTLTEGLTAVLGWHELLFRTWYITGALLGGAPLAQGTVYLLFPRRIANALTVPLLTVVAVAAVFVLLTPLDTVDKGTKLLETSIIQWTWVRAFSPFINTYAFIFLVGGAAYSAIHFRHSNPRRAAGTAAIAFGAILPGIGGCTDSCRPYGGVVHHGVHRHSLDLRWVPADPPPGLPAGD